MASYIQTVLGNGENVIHEGKISVWSLAPSIILGILTLPLFGIGIFFLVKAYLAYISTEMAITNKRVIAKFGFISRKTVEMNLKKIETVQVEQGILGRLFNFGTLAIAGGGNPQTPVPGIGNPLQFRQAVMSAQEAAA